MLLAAIVLWSLLVGGIVGWFACRIIYQKHATDYWIEDGAEAAERFANNPDDET